MRFLKSFTAAAVAISMAGTPVLAQSSAAPLSVAHSVSRSGAAMHDSNGLTQQIAIGIGVVLALIAAAILIPEATKPNSP